MADNALIEVIENILLTPSSDFYIATILHDPAGNALDPRTVDVLDLGTFNIDGINLGIVIKNLTVHGLSNVQVIFDPQGNPDITVSGNTVTFHARLPNTQPGYTRPPDVPSQVQAHGALNVTIAGQPMPPGTLDLTLQRVEDLTGVFTATESTGGDLSTLEVQFTSVSVHPRLGDGNMTITVNLPTVFVSTINHVLNQPGNQAALLEQVNLKLASPDILNSLSQVATQQARKALASQQ